MYLRLIENAWLKCEKYQTDQEALIEESFKNHRLTGLLWEQTNQADAVVSDLNAAADKATKSLDDILGKVPQKMGNLRDALNNAKKEVAANRLKTGISLSNLLGDPMKQLSKLFANVQILQGSIANAFQTVQGALGDLGAKIATNEEDRDKTLGGLLDLYSADIAGIPSRTDFEKAIIAQLKAPKGVFGGLGQGFSNMLGSLGLGSTRDIGFGLQQQQFVEEMLTLTPDELDSFLKSAATDLDDAAQPGDDDPVQAIDAIVTDAGLDNEMKDIATETSPGATEAPPGGDGISLTRQNLKDIKGAMDQAKSKKKSQTRALGGALNQIIGKPVFSEGVFYTYTEIKGVLRESLISNNNTMHSRWLKMAGLKDEK